MYLYYVPLLCPNYVPLLCTSTMYLYYVPLLYPNYVHLLCTSTMYIYYVPLLCTSTTYLYYVPILCTSTMYLYYVPLLCTSTMSQLCPNTAMPQLYVDTRQITELPSIMIFKSYIVSIKFKIVFTPLLLFMWLVIILKENYTF